MTDDSGDSETAKQLDERYGDRFVIFHTGGIGQQKCLDILFDHAINEYIFHCEDDWEFREDSFIPDSLLLLQRNRDVHQVWLRDVDDHEHGNIGQMQTMFDSANYCDINYWNVNQDYNGWNGYSWNPGLRRKSDYKRMFPSGIAAVGDEYQCAQHTKQFNYRTIVLESTACKHIGGGRHVV